VAVKAWFVGDFEEGPVLRPGKESWDGFRRWLLEAMTQSSCFKGSMEPYINTEVLSIKYRLMGAQIGQRVNIDYFQIVEFDLLSVADDVVFGSNVVINCSDDMDQQPIVLETECNVLDHTCLMPGTRVCRLAVTGSYTLGPKGHVFAPTSISTGSVGGKPLLLKFQGDIDAGTSNLPEAEQDNIRAAKAKHHDPWNFLSFNMFNIVSVMFLDPLPQFMQMTPVVVAWELLAEGFPAWVAWATVPLTYLLLNIGMVGVIILAKKIVIGTFTEGNYPFYESYHLRWIWMMLLTTAADPIINAMQGTRFLCWYAQLMGATIGKDVCLFLGCGLEFDLLFLEDHATTGDECDLTCHTVENMVIKLAKVTVGKGATMHAESVVMPGASMEYGAVLKGSSQVLKGETVEARTIWAGLPAALVGRHWEALVRTESELTCGEEYDTITVQGKEVHSDLLMQAMKITKQEARAFIKKARSSDPFTRRIHRRGIRTAMSMQSNHLASAVYGRVDVLDQSLGPKRKPTPRHGPPPRLIAKFFGISIHEARDLVERGRQGDPEAQKQMQEHHAFMLQAHHGLPVGDAKDLIHKAFVDQDPRAQAELRGYKPPNHPMKRRIQRLSSMGNVATRIALVLSLCANYWFITQR